MQVEVLRFVFIGQLLNPAKLTSDGVSQWNARSRDKDLWPLQQKFNQLLEAQARQLRAGYIGLDVNAFTPSDFVDEGHFSVQGSAKFASLIADDIRRDCQ